MASTEFWMKSKCFDWGFVSFEEARDKVAHNGAHHWSEAEGDVVSVVSRDGSKEYEMQCLPDGEGVAVKRLK